MGTGCPQAEQTVIKLLLLLETAHKMFCVWFICESNAVRIATLVQESLLEMCGWHAIAPQMPVLILPLLWERTEDST